MRRIRLTTLLLLLAPVALLAADASRPPAAQWTTWIALGGIRFYQRTVSPLLPAVGVRCRFTPTCSRYAEAVLERHGFVRGGAMTVIRIARCGPWTPVGTSDPPR